VKSISDYREEDGRCDEGTHLVFSVVKDSVVKELLYLKPCREAGALTGIKMA